MIKEKNPKHEPLDFDPIKMEKISEELEKDPENANCGMKRGFSTTGQAKRTRPSRVFPPG